MFVFLTLAILLMADPVGSAVEWKPSVRGVDLVAEYMISQPYHKCMVMLL